MRYKVTVSFSGTATIDMEAASPEAARVVAEEMTLPDLARQSASDVRTLKIAAKEITEAAALSGEEEEAAENGPRPARPSGWYRPG